MHSMLQRNAHKVYSYYNCSKYTGAEPLLNRSCWRASKYLMTNWQWLKVAILNKLGLAVQQESDLI